MDKQKSRKNGLDFLRFMACIGILFLHFSNYFCPDGVFFGNCLIDPDTTDNIGINMNSMVEIFFALSGFLIYSYSKKIQDGMSIREFMLPRLIRILPMLTIATILLVIGSYIMIKSGNTHGAEFGYPYLWGIISSCLGIEYNGFFVSAEINHESWYLDVLLECYLLFFITEKLSKRLQIKQSYIYVACILIGAAISSSELIIFVFNSQQGRGIEAFFSGVMLALYLDKNVIRKKEYLLAGLLLFIYSICLIFWPQGVSFGKTHLYNFFITPSLIILFSSNAVDRLFSLKIWNKMGKICFSTYTLHVALIYFLFIVEDQLGLKVDHAHEVILVFFVILALLIGSIAYYCIERPLGRYLIKKMNLVK